jgi:hypothetical protein
MATAGYVMCFIIFLLALYLRCMSLLLVVLDVIPQIQVGAEMVAEVTCRLLYFLVDTMLSAMTATTVCSTLASTTCATPCWLRSPP